VARQPGLAGGVADVDAAGEQVQRYHAGLAEW
jgi:hypothetical protein